MTYNNINLDVNMPAPLVKLNFLHFVTVSSTFHYLAYGGGGDCRKGETIRNMKAERGGGTTDLYSPNG